MSKPSVLPPPSITPQSLRAFMRESNHIEGIDRPPTNAEIRATGDFLALMLPTVDDVCALVSVYQPDARLRDRPGFNVRVGHYIAPAGGPEIRTQLASLLGSDAKRSAVRAVGPVAPADGAQMVNASLLVREAVHHLGERFERLVVPQFEIPAPLTGLARSVHAPHMLSGKHVGERL